MTKKISISATPAACPGRAAAVRAVRVLQERGFTAFWAGGCVRDMLLGRHPSDHDIVTDADPDQVLNIFPNAVAVGKSFGVVRVQVDGIWFEVATFRRDMAYHDGRRPESVVYSDAPTDAMRRDFTINALFYDPIADKLYDYVGGQDDLEARLIKCVGNPSERFAEDHLRMLRAVRFASVLDFTIEPQTRAAIIELAPKIVRISPERIRDELNRILLESVKAGDAVMLMDEVGLLEHILPEVKRMQNQEQPPQFHPEGDVFTHTMIMLNAMKRRTLTLVLAVLLHDVGKPSTASLDGDRIRFNGHAEVGAEMVRAIMERLRYPHHDIDRVTACVRNHMRFIDVTRMRKATLRRLIGDPSFNDQLELHRLDCEASHGQLDNYEFLVKFREQLDREPVLPAPLVNGRDVLALGIPSGPRVGRLLHAAYERQLETGASRGELLDALRRDIRNTDDQDLSASSDIREETDNPIC